MIVNREGVSHHDVLALMEMTRERVKAQLGITLHPEIKMLGFSAPFGFEADPLELVAAH